MAKSEALTEEQKKAYVDGSGYTCPYCGSDNLNADTARYSEQFETVVQSVACSQCGRMWTDEYTLTAIHPSPKDDE